jgi:hypothetical protein
MLICLTEFSQIGNEKFEGLTLKVSDAGQIAHVPPEFT